MIRMQKCPWCKKDMINGPIVTGYDDDGVWVDVRLCPYCKLMLKRED